MILNEFYYVDEKSALPSVLIEEPTGEWSDDEGTDSGSTHCDSGGQRPLLLKVEADNDDSRDVNQAEADATDDAHRHVEELHRCSKDGHSQRRRCQHTSGNRHRPESKTVRQYRHERTYASTFLHYIFL